MVKKKILVYSAMMSAVLIGIGYMVISLAIGGSSGGKSDSSLMPMGTFFVIFILPGIIAHQKKKKA
ncbi:MAG: hypothetical protein ACW972_02910 [Promethearchaeota archaeon]